MLAHKIVEMFELQYWFVMFIDTITRSHNYIAL